MCFAVFRELPVWGDEMLSVSLVLFAYDKIYVEGEDHYVKQTYRNRCVMQ